MRIRTPLTSGAAAVLLAGLACSIDDNSAAVFVEVQASAPVVVRGEKVGLQARARRVVGVDTVDIKNIRFVWTTSDPARATVLGDDFGGAELTGVNAGLVDVMATAVAFDASSVGYFQMRVANVLEVDSVRPTSVQWGDKIAIYGVGVRNVFIADLGTPLFPDTLTFQGDPQGLGRMEFWVPPPARTTQLFVLGPGVFFTDTGTTAVDTVDRHEFNDTIPSLLSLDGPGPYPTQIPSLLYFNPALSFEEPPRDSVGSTPNRFDWYRFARADTTKPLTLILKPAGLVDSVGLFMVISDSIRWIGGHVPGFNPTWFVTSQGGNTCSSRSTGVPVAGGFFATQSRRDSMALTFKRLPGYGGNRGFHVLAFYTQPQRYALTMIEGFQPTDQRIGQDRFEENDLCSFADSNFNLPATQIVVTSTPPLLFTVFQDSSLTIDTPYEFDWYRFRLNAAAAESVTVKVRSRPFGGPLVIDRSDLDLYVMRAADFAFMGSVSSAGSRDSLRLLLAPGEYYVVVVDFAGEVTRYSLCIRPRLSCAPLVTAAEASVVAGSSRKRTSKGIRRAPEWVSPGSPLQPFRRP